MTDNGYNPIYWDCKNRGCFNVECRPKIEQFAECFPGLIAMGDWDGVVERNGHFLVLEWKTPNAPLKTGQEITLKAFTNLRKGNVVFVVEGNPKTMVVERFRFIWEGTVREWIEGDLDDLKERFRNWFAQAEKNFAVEAA